MARNDTRAKLSPPLVKPFRFALAAGALLALAGTRLPAQSPTMTPLVTIGSESDQRVRLSQLLGATTDGYSLRSVSTRTPRLAGDSARPRWTLLAPEVTTVWNSWNRFSLDDPGQSTIGVRFGALVGGLSTENEWWGPGIRNAIVLSNNAAGIPRAFLRTGRPLHTRIGTIEGSWFLGGLFESPYFDNVWQDDRRSISGIALTWRPKFEPDLTLGFARTVYASMLGWDRLPTHLFDVLRNRGTRVTPDSGAVNSREQIAALSGRWVFPAARFAAHFEWARTELPTSLRDFLTSPTHSQGYTLGLEWATPVGPSPNLLRFQAEHTYLERSPSYRDRPLASFYTSGSVAQGYTQRGKVIGAAIGQGGSGHWLGLDYFMPRWRVGLQLGRIRWDDDALYRFPSYYLNKWCAHDVSLFAGVEASHSSRWGRISASLTRGERINMFFYHVTWCGSTADRPDILDARNTTLEVRLSAP